MSAMESRCFLGIVGDALDILIVWVIYSVCPFDISDTTRTSHTLLNPWFSCTVLISISKRFSPTRGPHEILKNWWQGPKMTRDYHFLVYEPSVIFATVTLFTMLLLPWQEVSNDLAGSDFRSEGLGDENITSVHHIA